MKSVVSAVLLLICMNTLAQEAINQFDERGRRHGLWRKSFEESPKYIRYEGTFEHGKEVGLFKFYQLGSEMPAATKEFSVDSDTAYVKYLTQKGKVISEGKMLGKNRAGKWTYYHQNTEKPMMVEHYQNGLLHGERIVYFQNGAPTERSTYRKGQLHGEQLIYSEDGVLLKKFTYENDELHGPSKIYSPTGELLIEGEYKNDKHHGVWRYYQDGILKEQKNFPED